MSWLKLDDNAPHHRKVLAAGDVGAWLWLCGLAYCQRHATDGHIPREAVPFLGCTGWKAALPRVLSAGLWRETGDGYEVHDFLEWNDSAELRGQKTRDRNARVTRFRDRRKRDVQRDGNLAPTPTPLPEEPPLPPSGEGGRFTRAELRQAEDDLADYRAGQPRYVAPVHREPGREYPEARRCPHEPQCDDKAVCLALFALARRARVASAITERAS